jgi:hypothetical protein
MAKSVKKGLLAIWNDVDGDYRIEFQKWHNCEHITDRVTIPGFFVGRRYQRTGEAPDFFMYYETDDPRVLASEPYLYAVNHPTCWTKEVMTHTKNMARAIYIMLSSEGEKPQTEAPYIIIIKFNIDLGSENEVLQWYREEQLPKICLIPGIYRGRLYMMDEKVSHIQTEERKIHGGGPGQQKFLVLYEIASLDVPHSKAWQELYRIADNKMLKKIENIRYESYWLDFVMYAPAT